MRAIMVYDVARSSMWILSGADRELVQCTKFIPNTNNTINTTNPNNHQNNKHPPTFNNTTTANQDLQL